jgi:hypothetical protein
MWGNGASRAGTSSIRRWILGGCIAIVLVGLVMVLAPSLYEVVDEGRNLRPYDSGVVHKIEVADSLTLYADDESAPEVDTISGSALVALATAAFMACMLLGGGRGPDRLRRFYAVSAAGFAFLAADELFAIHETVGHNLLFLSDIPGVERPDDVIIALYLIPAVAFLVYFRDVLMSSSRAVLLFGAAIAAFALSGLADVAGIGADEALEIVTAGLIAAGFVTLLVSHLSQWVIGGPTATSAGVPAATPASAPAPASARPRAGSPVS